MTRAPEAGQAGATEITPTMIEAGVKAYLEWEPDHIWDEWSRAAPYAIRELVRKILIAAGKASNIHKKPDNQRG
jgi:hypothetical protein